MSSIYKSQYKFFENAYALDKDLWTDLQDDSMVRKVARRLKRENPEAKILDIGCGRGQISIQLAKLGFKVWGIDIVQKAIRESNKSARLAKVDSNTHFQKMDIFHLTFKENFFDGLIDRGCFHHIIKKDWKKYGKIINKILKPGGYFLLSVFSKKSPHLISDKHNYVVHKGDVSRYLHYDHFFTKSEIKDIFPGYEWVEFHEENENPYIFYNILMRKLNHSD